MAMKRRGDGDREAIIYMVAAVPFLMWHLILAYLRMRRRANKEGHHFYQALVRDGVPRDTAKELAEMYSSNLSLRQMIREMSLFTS